MLPCRAGLSLARLSDDNHRHAFESAQRLPQTYRPNIPQYHLARRVYLGAWSPAYQAGISRRRALPKIFSRFCQGSSLRAWLLGSHKRATPPNRIMLGGVGLDPDSAIPRLF